MAQYLRWIPLPLDDRPQSLQIIRRLRDPTIIARSKVPMVGFFDNAWFKPSSDMGVVPLDFRSNARSVREDTAELASWALSDFHNTASPQIQHIETSSTPHKDEIQFARRKQAQYARPHAADNTSRPDPIEEISESHSGVTSRSNSKSRGRSVLTDMIRHAPHTKNPSSSSSTQEVEHQRDGHRIVTVREGIISQPTEQTTLLLKKTAWRSDISPKYGSFQDLESLKTLQSRPWAKSREVGGNHCERLRSLLKPSSWTKEDLWRVGLRYPLLCVPPVVLGLLLNVLDALSYGIVRETHSSSAVF